MNRILLFVLFVFCHVSSANAQLYADTGLASAPFRSAPARTGNWFTSFVKDLTGHRYYPVIQLSRSYPPSYNMGYQAAPFARGNDIPDVHLSNPLGGSVSWSVTYVEVVDAPYFERGLNRPDFGYGKHPATSNPFGRNRAPFNTIVSTPQPSSRSPSAANGSVFSLFRAHWKDRATTRNTSRQ